MSEQAREVICSICGPAFYALVLVGLVARSAPVLAISLAVLCVGLAAAKP